MWNLKESVPPLQKPGPGHYPQPVQTSSHLHNLFV